MSLDELLNAANQLSETELETLVNGTLLLHARRKAPILPSQEASLLLQINQGISTDRHQRYHYLTFRYTRKAVAQPMRVLGFVPLPNLHRSCT